MVLLVTSEQCNLPINTLSNGDMSTYRVVDNDSVSFFGSIGTVGGLCLSEEGDKRVGAVR